MGTILLARDETLGRAVVFKILRKSHQDDAELNGRFRREAAITAQLQHPGVPTVFGLGALADARPCFSMTLVQGRTLAQLLAGSADRPRDRPRFLTVFQQVCQTIAFAHGRGVIHRDLKPENIVVGEYGVVYVMDWGIARLLRDEEPPGGGRTAVPSLPVAMSETACISGPTGGRPDAEHDAAMTVAGDLLGTPQYMSPEQARGDRDQDERADVFSLGAILFEILVGEPLRPATVVPRRLLERFADDHLETAARRLDACGADPPVVELARRCLDRDRDRRPADASEVASLLTAYLLHVLQRPERELARFFELSLDLFCVAGLDGYFKQVNRNFTRVLGYSSEELLSRPFLEYVHPDDREQTRAQVEALSQGQPVVRFENRYRDQRGNYKWFEWASQSVPDEGLIFAVAREITARKHLEQRIESIVESSPVAMVVTDQRGVIVLVNHETERLFGYDRRELVGRPVESLIPERFRAGHPALREAFLKDPSVRPGSGRELRGLRKDGAEIPIELGLSPFSTEEGLFVVSTITDLSARQHELSRQRAVFEASPVGMLLVDGSGTIRRTNRRAERLFGYSQGELTGRHVGGLVPAGEWESLTPRSGMAPTLGPAASRRPRRVRGLRKDGARDPDRAQGRSGQKRPRGPCFLAAVLE
ncbi:MAG: PAS domain S-box protein [Isosphaeraceae bacterium]